VTDVHLKPQQSVMIEIACGAPTPPKRLHAQVRRCRQFREGWFDCVVQLASAPPGDAVIDARSCATT